MDRMTWKEIQEKYPDRWVALTECDMDGVSILAGKVCAVCKDSDRLSEEIKLMDARITFEWRRTTDIEGRMYFDRCV